MSQATEPESTVTDQRKSLPVQVFQELDRRDENQILSEMRGEQLQEFVYSIKLDGREITNLSYAGVKEASSSEKQPEKVAGTVSTWKVPVAKDQVPAEFIKKGVRQYPLLRSLQSYGMLNQLCDEISIVPERPVDSNSPPVKWFIHGTSIKVGVVTPICQKYGLKWHLELDEKGFLKAIILYGKALEKKQIDELVQGATWAFKASLEEAK